MCVWQAIYIGFSYVLLYNYDKCTKAHNHMQICLVLKYHHMNIIEYNGAFHTYSRLEATW